MNNKIITVIIVVILVGGGFLLFKNKGVAPTGDELNNAETSVETSTQTTEPDLSGGTDERIGNPPGVSGTATTTTGVITTGVTKEFNVNATSFSFSPSTLTVNKGDTVKITLKNTNGTHDLKIDEFNVSTGVLNTGQEQTVTFVANKSGTFQYYCSTGNHRAMGMVGTLIVR